MQRLFLCSAELIDMAQQFFQTRANLCAFGFHALQFLGELLIGGLGFFPCRLSLGEFFQCRFLFLTQAAHQSHRTLDPLFQLT